ncbi:MAG: HNH endonuclease [Verrucomicrobiales bacterium]|nr:HNH endonuclease [Verrucomicrobiales bacterium]
MGYSNARSYHPWLRDEFAFRCIYCLNREQWGRVTGEFDVEHFLSQARVPSLATIYSNLFNACSRCNSAKGTREVPEPTKNLASQTIPIQSDGRLEPFTDEARSLIEKLRLNSPSMVRWRLIWMRNIELAREYDPEQFSRLMQYPDDLPNLENLRPPEGNAKPEGIEQSYYMRRVNGTLPLMQH